MVGLVPVSGHSPLRLDARGRAGDGQVHGGTLCCAGCGCEPGAAALSPKCLDDWVVAASGSWTVVLDNLSSIPEWLADAVCRAATGEGLVKRALFTDAELAVLIFRRLVVFTSIDAG